MSSVEEMEWKYGSSGLQSRLQRPHVDPDDGDGGASNMLAALAEREVPSSYSLKLAAKGCHLCRNAAKTQTEEEILSKSYLNFSICLLLKNCKIDKGNNTRSRTRLERGRDSCRLSALNRRL